jgi:hypothetical protein
MPLIGWSNSQLLLSTYVGCGGTNGWSAELEGGAKVYLYNVTMQVFTLLTLWWCIALCLKVHNNSIGSWLQLRLRL